MGGWPAGRQMFQTKGLRPAGRLDGSGHPFVGKSGQPAGQADHVFGFPHSIWEYLIGIGYYWIYLPYYGGHF